MIHTYVLDFDSPCTANYGQSPITKAASFCFVVCVIPTKMMYNNQGRKQFGDDLNDDESQPHRDGRERQGEVKKLDLLPLSKCICRGKSFIFVR